MSCDSKDLRVFLDLKNQPNGNYFPTKNNLHSVKLYPLKMIICKSCWLIQIDKFPSQKDLFSYHNYIDDDQWYDYSGGLIYGYKFDRHLGMFLEGKYNKYWNREWYDFKFGVNYIIF